MTLEPHLDELVLATRGHPADLQHIAVQLQPHTARTAANHPGLDGLHHRRQQAGGVHQAGQEAANSKGINRFGVWRRLAFWHRLHRVDVKLQQSSTKLPGQLGDLLHLAALGIDPNPEFCLSPATGLPGQAASVRKVGGPDRIPRILRSVGP